MQCQGAVGPTDALMVNFEVTFFAFASKNKACLRIYAAFLSFLPCVKALKVENTAAGGCLGPSWQSVCHLGALGWPQTELQVPMSLQRTAIATEQIPCRQLAAQLPWWCGVFPRTRESGQGKMVTPTEQVIPGGIPIRQLPVKCRSSVLKKVHFLLLSNFSTNIITFCAQKCPPQARLRTCSRALAPGVICLVLLRSTA